VDGLAKDQSEAAVQKALSEQLPGLLQSNQSQSRISMLNCLCLPGCIQLLAFQTWYAALPDHDGAPAGPDRAAAGGWASERLLAHLCECITEAIAAERSSSHQQAAPHSFHVQLHVEPGGLAECREGSQVCF